QNDRPQHLEQTPHTALLIGKSAGAPYSATIGLRSTPIFSISTSTVSPGLIFLVTLGVPVKIRSPRSSVMYWLVKLRSVEQSKIRSSVDCSCTTSPFRRVRSMRPRGLSPVTIQGPTGPQVSKLLARHHCMSLSVPCCQSRSQASLPMVSPKTAASLSSLDAFFSRLPSTSTSSPS